MSALEFVDTNVLLYAYDTSAGRRHELARSLVRRLGRERLGAVSIQVLQEFHVNATSKVARRLSNAAARERLATLGRWTVHVPVVDDVLSASRLAERHQLSFWDAMIVTSANVLGCRVLHTEDLNHGQVIEDVKITNPFA